MSATRHISPDPAAAAFACAEYIRNLIAQKLETQPFITLAISGGSTPKLMFQALPAGGFPAARVHLFWVDERVVPPTAAESNYRLTLENLIEGAQIPPRNIHRVFGELDPQTAAQRYEDDIRAFFQLVPGGLPRFDIVQCGMGPEGHIASLFPGEPLLNDREQIAAAVTTPKPPPSRVTLLPGPLLAARDVVFLVAGSDKSNAVYEAFAGEYRPESFPVQLICRRAAPVTWFLDRAAAARLV